MSKYVKEFTRKTSSCIWLHSRNKKIQKVHTNLKYMNIWKEFFKNLRTPWFFIFFIKFEIYFFFLRKIGKVQVLRNNSKKSKFHSGRN
jgi:hypothetical protein